MCHDVLWVFVQVHEGQSTPSFIQALASRISGFTELINTLKASQRQQYASLLQQEQQLLQELQAVHIADDADPLQQDDCSQDSSSEQHPVSSGWQDSDAVGSRYRNDSPNKHRQQSHHNCSTSQPQQWSSKAAKAVTPRRVNSRAGTTDNTAAHNSSSDLLPEVVAYNNFLARHGPTGGWHPDDHNTFMSVLRSSRYASSARRSACRLLHLVLGMAVKLPVYRQLMIVHITSNLLNGLVAAVFAGVITVLQFLQLLMRCPCIPARLSLHTAAGMLTSQSWT